MAVASTIPRRRLGARQLALALLAVTLAALLAWYLVAIWFDLAPWLRGWKKYPDGWSWRFLETVPRLDRFSTAATGIAFIGAALVWLTRTGESGPLWRLWAALTLLVIGAHTLEVGTLALKLSSPHALLVNRILDEDFTGYFDAARSVQSPEEFFTDWRRLMKACGHCTSHPTGASAFFWPLIRITDLLPPATVDSVSTWLQEALRLRVRNVPAPNVVAALLNGHLMLWLAALSVVPYFWLGRIIGGSVAGGVITAGLVATQPGLILMSPELDQVYVLISGTALLLVLLGLRTNRQRTAVTMGALCGLSLAAGLFLTWGFLLWIPLLLCVGGAWLLGLHAYRDDGGIPIQEKLGRLGCVTVATAAGTVIPYVLLGMFTPYDVRDVARQGLGHYQTFEAIGRPGGAIWLMYGPLDTAQFTGLPLVLASIAMIVASAGRLWSPLPTIWSERLGQLNIYSIALIGIVAVTFLGGYMKAESGRQLLLIMPLAALSIAAATRLYSRRMSAWHWVLIAAQVLVTVMIGARWITP